MLRRLLWLTLVASALLLLLGLMAAQAEMPYVSLNAIPLQAAAMPSEKPVPTPANLRQAETPHKAPQMNEGNRSWPLPQAPEVHMAYHLRCFSAFHYPDRAG